MAHKVMQETAVVFVNEFGYSAPDRESGFTREHLADYVDECMRAGKAVVIYCGN